MGCRRPSTRSWPARPTVAGSSGWPYEHADDVHGPRRRDAGDPPLGARGRAARQPPDHPWTGRARRPLRACGRPVRCEWARHLGARPARVWRLGRPARIHRAPRYLARRHRRSDDCTARPWSARGSARPFDGWPGQRLLRRDGSAPAGPAGPERAGHCWQRPGVEAGPGRGSWPSSSDDRGQERLRRIDSVKRSRRRC
jgi:hypothetical protein